jgi:hypothetical protein
MMPVTVDIILVFYMMLVGCELNFKLNEPIFKLQAQEIHEIVVT